MNRQETILLSTPRVESAEGEAIGFALLLCLIGAALAVAGVYILFGVGWSLIAGSIPVTVFAAAMLRGVKRGA